MIILIQTLVEGFPKKSFKNICTENFKFLFIVNSTCFDNRKMIFEVS